jgi:hypothetical protein
MAYIDRAASCAASNLMIFQNSVSDLSVRDASAQEREMEMLVM